jgi:single-strand DNA-binding protein
MSNADLTLHGRLVDAPELRFTPQGIAVLNATVATSERKKNAAGEWEDGEASFIRVTAWRQMAEAIAEEDLQKGDPVIASGILNVRKWEKDGKTGYSTEMTLDDFGRSLKWPRKNKSSKPAAQGSEYTDVPPF